IPVVRRTAPEQLRLPRSRKQTGLELPAWTSARLARVAFWRHRTVLGPLQFLLGPLQVSCGYPRFPFRHQRVVGAPRLGPVHLPPRFSRLLLSLLGRLHTEPDLPHIGVGQRLARPRPLRSWLLHL